MKDQRARVLAAVALADWSGVRTIAKVTEIAGVGRSTIYEYFDDFEHAVRQASEEATVSVEQHLARIDIDGLATSLEALCEAWMGCIDATPLLFLSALAKHDRAAHEAGSSQHEDALEDALEDGLSQHEATPLEITLSPPARVLHARLAAWVARRASLGSAAALATPGGVSPIGVSPGRVSPGGVKSKWSSMTFFVAAAAEGAGLALAVQRYRGASGGHDLTRGLVEAAHRLLEPRR